MNMEYGSVSSRAAEINEGKRRFFEKFERQRRIKALDRNFSINVTPIGEGNNRMCSISLKSKDPSSNIEPFDLGQLLSPGFSFREGKEFGAHPISKFVEFPHTSEEISYRGFLLDLLHEIGHTQGNWAVTNLTLGESLSVRMQRLGKILLKPNRLYKLFRARMQSKDRYRDEEDKLLPGWAYERQVDSESKAERNSWAYAIRQAKQLEERGFNVLSGFRDQKEVRSFVRSSLGTYAYKTFIASWNRGEPFKKAKFIFSH